MARAPKEKAISEADVEIDPEAFERFRSAVHTLAKAKPRHREAGKARRPMPKTDDAAKG